MNCPSRTDDTLEHPGWNQNPPLFSPDTTTCNDFNGTANSKAHRKHATGTGTAVGDDAMNIDCHPHIRDDQNPVIRKPADGKAIAVVSGDESPPKNSSRSPHRLFKTYITSSAMHCAHILVKYSRFIGPGFLIAVSYIDPGNYATDVAAGSSFRYALLFIVLLSNLFAILLQSLCIKLGTVTGLNLAENCREHLPRWIVYILYVFAEAAIVATDIAEVCVDSHPIP